MNNPFDYTPDAACDTAFRELTSYVEALKTSERDEDRNFIRELEAGKMLGVLIAADSRGERHTLYAFSGQLGDEGFHYPGFVGPVFDYLQPEGYFKMKEAEISNQNKEIVRFEKEELQKVRKEYEEVKATFDAQLEDYKDRFRKSKQERAAKRESGGVEEAEQQVMIRQSQFEKAELRRVKKRLSERLIPFESQLKEAERHLSEMKERRRADSEALQGWLFDNFKVLNARGESRNLKEIFSETAIGIPPSGAGECCAPKLLQEAYKIGWTPLSIAEYWYGQSKSGEVRIHGEYYPACRGKCLPVLSWMLQGLEVDPPLNEDSTTSQSFQPEVIFENEWFCIVNKPSGMLSVPGKGKAVSVQQWLERRYSNEREVKLVHRLDQDTSGLLIAAFGAEAYKTLQSLFATRKVRKTYLADLEGDYRLKGLPDKGRIELPLSPDWLDRPRQRVDYEGGKPAITDHEFVEVSGGRSRVLFHPMTGRTHQLRVHAASEQGLGMPIVGDRLYGKQGGKTSSRLHLHAWKLEFDFPPDNHPYIFESPNPDF